MFGSLVPHECLHYIRHQTDLSPTIYRTIQHFNKIICLVITTILQPAGGNGRQTSTNWRMSSSFGLSFDSSTTDSVSGDEREWSDSCCLPHSCTLPRSHSNPGSHVQRGKYISHWIDIAQQCRLLKNFSSLKAIVFGLQSSSISRLGQSWDAVSV